MTWDRGASHHLSTVMSLIIYIFFKMTRFPKGYTVLGSLWSYNVKLQIFNFPIKKQNKNSISTMTWSMTC
ncbi:hypothetical protein PFLUV_G00181800 [Perca fluviatilis]|uniref:Uncharacterized protein n=1 Tax=Perca fluviatilis TaxID=8168 RepID=A0A6A5ENM3_PERFL|nr:hypothetical protein PFLUV_G00181800 [Perca fluviatilis]